MIYYPPPTIPRILALNSTGDIGGLSQIPVDSIYQAPITIFSVGKIGALTPNATRFLLPNFCESTDESFSAYVVPQDGNIGRTIICNYQIIISVAVKIASKYGRGIDSHTIVDGRLKNPVAIIPENGNNTKTRQASNKMVGTRKVFT